MKKFILQNILFALVLFALHFFIGNIELYKDFNTDALLRALFNPDYFSFLVMGLMILYQLIYIRRNKIAMADFDITPNQSAAFTAQKTMEESIDIIENSLAVILKSDRFEFYEEEGSYKAKTKTTFNSWGENITIKLTKIDNYKTQISILSKSRLKTTLVDFGKGSMNIHKIKSVFGKPADNNGLAELRLAAN